MKIDRDDMLLYLVTDRRWLKEQSLAEVVELAIKNKVSFVQLREKHLEYDEFKQLAIKIKKIIDKSNIPFVINDNIDVAVKIDADGLHVGQDDISALEARKIMGTDKILGVSVSNIDEAIQAEKDGADYLGLGALFPTDSKLDSVEIGLEDVKKITSAVNIPVVGIGGINASNIHLLRGSGLAGIAVISAILAKEDIGKAARELYNMSKGVLHESSPI